MIDARLEQFSRTLGEALGATAVEDGGFEHVVELAATARKGRVFFIGNGGSAAIASHMAIDWMNKGGFAAHSFNDGASLTCLANDHGYGWVFDIPLVHHAHHGDLIFAISSSGQSQSIVRPAFNSRSIANVVTLSGFEPDNDLRKAGKVNFYVPSRSYPIVENAHMAILHVLLEAVK